MGRAHIKPRSVHRHATDRATTTSGVHHLSVQNLPSILPTSSSLSVVNIIGPHFPCRIPRPALKLVSWRRVLLAEACCKSIPHSSVQIGCAENMSRGKEMPEKTKLEKMRVGQSGQKVRIGAQTAQCVRTRGLGGHQVDAGS